VWEKPDLGSLSDMSSHVDEAIRPIVTLKHGEPAEAAEEAAKRIVEIPGKPAVTRFWSELLRI
jgi:hypothetical protein